MKRISEVNRNLLTLNPDRLLDERQAAGLLGLSHRTLQAWRLTGGGPPYIKMGMRSVRYSLAAINAWIRTQARAHTAAGAEFPQ